jgi:hypothetical protein
MPVKTKKYLQKELCFKASEKFRMFGERSG